ncbi:hypothetical protein BDV95DRAFT_582020 [Massariosphaeria phaeospora]|uniref:Zn(2)-C6 fungal-type domain-containing protein n=1 Tax=Massariosphaeria phaeospora TaxID=100035 RepID=A0A7C8I7T6_9PLEO|nr:hypothetical protein BDV95DRAFT_582020 [Massariosphaeria phaeospora]
MAPANGNAPTGKKDYVRKKIWRPKTKTGCITCRIRRVKCDEVKPYCQRCTSTGRKCDGYTTAAPSTHTYQMVYSRSPLSFAKTGLDLNTTEEQEAFHFFKQHSASELSGFFDAVFWQSEILQASHSCPSIRYAVIALAALHRKFIVGRMPVVAEDTSDKQLRFALLQSNRAIQEILRSPVRKSISDKITIMASCVLFNCLASMQGHQNMALEHLRSGLKILREVDQELASGEGDDPSDHPISLSTLRTIFLYMSVQARGVMSNEMMKKWGPKPVRRPTIPPTTFKTFLQARLFFEAILNALYAFFQDLDADPPANDEETQASVRQYESLQDQFEEGSTRLAHFLSQLCHTNEEDREAVIGIRLIHLQIRFHLRACEGFNAECGVIGMNLHVDEHDLAEILDLVGQLLKAPANLTLSPGAVPQDYYPAPGDERNNSGTEGPTYSRPVFSSNSGLLSGLWLVACMAIDPAQRRRSIAMLLNYPRREGVWDSVLAGRIAWEQMVLEEAAALGEYEEDVKPFEEEKKSIHISEKHKIRAIDIRYTDTRVATIKFQTLDEYKAGDAGRVTQIAW